MGRTRGSTIPDVPRIFFDAQLAPPTDVNSINGSPFLTTTSMRPDEGSRVSDAGFVVRLSLVVVQVPLALVPK
jgi:hypothetical protein